MMDENNSRKNIKSLHEHANVILGSKSTIKEQFDVEPTSTTNDTPVVHAQHNLSKLVQSRTMASYVVIWLRSSIHNSDEDTDDSISKLQHIINLVETYTDPNQCVDFLTDVKDGKVFMIISQLFGPSFISLIENIPQLQSIYVFDNEQIHDTQSMQGYKKVKGVFTHIESICNALKLDVSRLIIDLKSFSIVSNTSSPNLDELDQSFMYTQLLKEIILELEHNANSKLEFVNYYRTHFQEQGFQSKSISQFQRYYEDHSPVWWYTKEWFIYSTLNMALRTQDTETIIKMGFFLQDLHREIAQKHSQTPHTSKMVVYRGQGVPETDFEKMKKNKSGLISFNNFLSTIFNREVSLMYVDSVRQNREMIGILFRIEIDPSIASTPYVSVDNISNFESEEEILFSMHSIFRIGDMIEINDQLWEINLTLTSDNDPQLKCLIDYIREELGAANGWYRMGLLMQKMGKFDKALEIFHILLQTALSDDSDIHHLSQTEIIANIGVTHQSIGNYSDALQHMEQALENQRKSLPSSHPNLAAHYNNIGPVHQSMGNYAMALSYLEKALAIWQKSLPSNHSDLADNYNNIGLVHQSVGNSPMALSYLEKALEIWQKSLPFNHPDLAANYNNIGEVHRSIGNYAMALSYFEKALETHQISLPSNHPNLALNYNNIGEVHQSMGDYPMALSYFKKALAILQKSLPSAHPDLALNYNNIGLVHQSMGNYPIALSYLEKALAIWQKSLPFNHPNLALNYNNITAVH